MPLIRPSYQRTPLSNQLPCSVTSPLPTLPTRKASGWRMERKSQTHGQSRGTQHTGDKQLCLYVVSRIYFWWEEIAQVFHKYSLQWKVNKNVCTIFLNAYFKMEVATQTKSNAEVVLHNHISVSNSGGLVKFLSENVGEQNLAETKAVYWLLSKFEVGVLLTFSEIVNQVCCSAWITDSQYRMGQTTVFFISLFYYK